MMSSVIPARLTFQCGHAALVTLPRVKGETSAQRNERIAHEKSAALVRQCDFCGPAVEVEVALPSNGSHPVAELADVLEAQPIVASEPEETTEPMIEAVVVDELVDEIVEELSPVEEVLVIVETVDEATEPQPPLKTAETPKNGAVHARRQRARRLMKSAAPVAHQTQPFVVEYQSERILQATDIRDALRQTAALGAREVLSITRED